MLMTRNRFWSLACALVLAMVLSATGLYAQVDTGTISGTVQDQSGGIVPNASVKLTNEGTGFTSTKVTAGDGTYIFTPIRIGSYEILVEVRGFRTVRRTNITVDVQQHVVVDITLVPGAVAQTINVTATPPLIQTQSGSRGQVVSTTAINDLPLNGRNYTILAQLVPGSSMENASYTSLQATGSFIANGERTTQNNYMLDGADNNNKLTDFSNAAGGNTSYILLPPVDAIAEFKIQTNAYSAEFGRGAGGVENATTKSGSNGLHGDLWEFVRNNTLDSADFFQDAAGITKGKYQRNQFGGTVGGPVLLPHVYNGKNKTFFFFDYEGERIRQASPFTATVPTAAERNSGYTNFSDLITLQSGALLGPDAVGRKFPLGTIFDPATTRPATSGQVDPVTGLVATANGYLRDPFAGNQIPANRLFTGGSGQGAVGIFNLLPPPVKAGLNNNFTGNFPYILNDDTYDIRVDQNFSSRDQFFARYSHAYAPMTETVDLQDTRPYTSAVHGGVGSWIHAFSPSLVNEMRAGYTRLHYTALQEGATTPGIPAEYGITGVPQGSLLGGLPSFVIGGMAWTGTGTWVPDNRFSMTTDVTDNFTKVYGKHMLKAGLQYEHMAFPFDTVKFGRGRWSFGGTYTSIPGVGDSTTGRAEFLISPMPSTVPNGIDYVGGSDSLSVTNAANIALSQNYYGFYFQDDWKVTSKLTLNLGLREEYYQPFSEHYGAIANLIPGPGWAGGQFVVPSLRKNTPFSASILSAFAKDGITLTYRSGTSVVDVPNTLWAPRAGFAYRITPKLVMRGGGGIFYGMADNEGGGPNIAFNYPFIYTLSYPAPDPGHPLTSGATIGALSNGLSNVPLTPASVTSALSPNMMDSPFNVPTIYNDNLTLEYQMSSNTVANLAYVGSMARHLDSNTLGNLPSVLLPPSVSPQSYVPYPDLARGDPWITPQSNSYYHSLQLSFERKFSGGLNFFGNYTWSKARDDGGDPLWGRTESYYRGAFVPGVGIKYDYALSDFDAPHIFHFAGIYQFPIGHGMRFLANSPGVVNAILGGWQTNWILTLQSGNPDTILCTVTEQASGNCYALRVPGQNVNAGPHNVNQYWNPAAFANPAHPVLTVGQTDLSPLGGAPTQVRGPGYHRMDWSMFKQFRTTEKTHLEFRAEFFNITNTPQFAFPSVTNFMNTTSFGQISATRDAPNDARQIQLALKLYF